MFKGITQSLRSLFYIFLEVFLNDYMGEFGPEIFTKIFGKKSYFLHKLNRH